MFKKAAKKAASKKAARERTLSQNMYNARRRALRASNNLRKLAENQKGKARQNTLNRIAEINDKITHSFYDRKTKSYSISYDDFNNSINETKGIVQELRFQTRKLNFRENARLTKMQKSYFKMGSLTEEQRANKEERTDEQLLARAEADFFYAATRVLWQGGSPELRDENIIAGLKGQRLENGQYVTNLQTAVQFIKEQYGDAYPTIDSIKKSGINTDSDEQFAGEAEPEDDSPPGLTRSGLRALLKGAI